MNRFLITTIVFFSFNAATFSQIELTETQKLVRVAKVWGFLKYYHPNIAKGKFDWDKALIEILPKVKKVNSQDDLSQLLTNWIETFGRIKKCRKCSRSETNVFDKNFDLAWTKDSTAFNGHLIAQLTTIESNRHLGEKRYVAYLNGDPSAAKMVNENVFEGDSWKDPTIRLITLFRYWNFIEYFFPYKYQTDIPWNETLDYLIPVFLNVESETEYHLALLELVARINDSHGVFTTDKTFAYFGDRFLPVVITYKDSVGVVTGFYNDSLASLDGFQMGDIITKLNGKTVASIYTSVEKYINGSNESAKSLRASKYVFNGSSDSLKIEFYRDGILHSNTVHRYAYVDFKYTRKEQPIYEIVANNIGYINMGKLEQNAVVEVFSDLITTEGLILDFRNGAKNSCSLVIDQISSREKAFCRTMYPNLNYPGKFTLYKPFTCGTNEALRYHGKVVLLVDAHTQSNAEYAVMMLQTGDNVVTVGSTTSGADGNTTGIQLVDNYKTAISGTGVFYPDMTETQRKGIKIDYYIEQSMQNLSENSDALFEKAIQLLTE